jgi:hypothetical protein
MSDQQPSYWKIPRLKIETIITVGTILVSSIGLGYKVQDSIRDAHNAIVINKEEEQRDVQDLRERIASERARAIESEVKLQNSEEQLAKYIQEEMVPRSEGDSKDKLITDRLDGMQRSLDRVQTILMYGKNAGHVPIN